MIQLKHSSNTWLTTTVIAVAGYGFLLTFGYFLTDTPEKLIVGNRAPKMEEIEVALDPEQLAALEAQEAAGSQPAMSEEVKNLIASSESQQVNTEVNYVGESQSKGNASGDGAASALAYARQMTSQLTTTHTDHSVPNNTQTASSGTSNTNTERGGTTSYSGPVSATVDLSGRSIRQAPKPTYKCKTAGTVVMAIEVDETGKVTSVKINDALSTHDACLREESLTYARRWLFSVSSTKKQLGSITFLFSAQ